MTEINFKSEAAKTQAHAKPIIGFAEAVFIFIGIFISFLAFFSFHIFVEKMVKDEYDRQAKSTIEFLITGLNDLETAMGVVSSVFTITSENDQNYRSSQFKSAFENIKRFDQILLINQDKKPSKSFQRNETLQNLYVLNISDSKRIERLHTYLMQKGFFDPVTYPERSEGELKLARKDLKKVIEPRLRILSEPTLFLEITAQNSQNLNKDSEGFQSEPFAIVRYLPGTSESDGTLIIGVTHVGKILSKEWLNKNPHASFISIKDVETGQDFFSFDKGMPQAAEFNGSERVSSDFQLGDKIWGAQLNFVKENTIHFIQAVPYFIIFFGFLTTTIGVLFVHNNQKNAGRLTAMNRKLELKNYELQSEIEKRASLNDFLQKSEREKRAIVDSVSDIIFETDTDGRIVFLNATWQKVTGFDPEQSIDLDLFKMLHPEDQEKQRDDFHLLVQGKKEAYRTFTRLRTSQGNFRAVELSISMMRQDTSKDMRVVGTFTDVEERRRAERALSEAEKKYRNIVENAAGGIFQLTPEGLYLSVNPSFAIILGYQNQQELLKNIKNANEDVYVDKKQRGYILKELEEKGALNNIESEICKKNGDRIWINENVRAVRDDLGNTLYYEGSIEDISQRKKSDFALREAKIHSDLANRAKSEFLANMSHELRTPLNAIIGFSEMIKNEVFGKIEQGTYKEYAQDIYDSGTNLLDIINEILDIARIEAHERQLNENSMQISDVAGTCLSLLGTKIKDNNLTITNMLQDMPIVIAEELALKQVFMNLLSNAIKFTPKGGRITLSYEQDREGQLHVSVTDTGVGLEEHEIDKILSPFGQAENAYSRSNAGTGLGLTLVDALVKLHGGRLEIISQKGIGTTVTFILPENRVKEKLQKKRSAHKTEAGEKIDHKA